MASRDLVNRRTQYALRWARRAAVEHKTEFDKRLVLVTEKVLKEIFGDAATNSICKYLEKNYDLKLEEIPSKLDVFSRALESYLDSGATVVEEIILKNLHTKSEVDSGRFREKTFQQRLSDLRQIYKS
jgi:phage gp36-like protein